MATATKTYTLNYSTMTLRDGGTYDLGNSTEFGTAQGDDGTFESPEDAMYWFKNYMSENHGDVQDVTESEGFQGWGTVIRVSSEEYGDTLYSITVSESE